MQIKPVARKDMTTRVDYFIASAGALDAPTEPIIDRLTRKMMSLLILATAEKTGTKLVVCPACGVYTSNQIYTNGKLSFTAMCIHNLTKHRKCVRKSDLRLIDEATDLECKLVPDHLINLNTMLKKEN